jgi:hypothetical protein
MAGSRARSVVFTFCAVVAIGLVYLAPRLRAQIPGSLPSPTIQQPDLMLALLAEVKAIRAEVREAARMSTRSQLLLGRVQLQQLQLGRLDQRLAMASARRIEAAKDRATTASQLRDLERRRLEDLPADQRPAAEADRRRLSAQLKEQQSFEAQRRREEIELTDALSAEEERLRELIARLDALELR